MKKFHRFYEDASTAAAEAAAEAAAKKAEEEKKKAAKEAEDAAKAEAEAAKAEALAAKAAEEQALKDKIRAKQLQKSAEEMGIAPATVASAARAGERAFTGHTRSIGNVLVGRALGGAYGVARKVGSMAVGAGIATAKQVPTAAANVAGAGIATAKAAGRAIKATPSAVPSAVSSLYQKFRSGTSKLADRFKSGRRSGLTSSYEYSELISTMSQLNEQEFNAFVSQLNDQEFELVEQAIESIQPTNGYTNLRMRLNEKYGE
jgi:colicin import membrane protein